MRYTPSKQIQASYRMGRIEAQVALKDLLIEPIKAKEFAQYIKDAELTETVANRNVLEFIRDSGILKRSWILRKRFKRYTTKYYKNF